jgi:hypothetical protein
MGGSMDKVKKLWAWAKENKKISSAIVIVIVLIIVANI